MTKPYEVFAQYYDYHMRHVDYPRWLQQILTLYARHSKRTLHKVHELACGTANVASLLVEQGYQVSASDSSNAMLQIAQTKQFAPELSLADMTAALPDKGYDLVLCLFDSINYLLADDQVHQLLNSVAAALPAEGLFIFDISTLKNSLDNFNHYVDVVDKDDCYLVHQADYDELKHRQITHLTMFQRYDNHYLRSDETHEQKVYRCAELSYIIDNSPLICEGIYSLYYDKNMIKQNINKLDYQYSRLFFVLKKPVK